MLEWRVPKNPMVEQRFPCHRWMVIFLSTNADKIVLRLSENTEITITAENLDEDMTINVRTLTETDQDAWKRLVTDRTWEGVQIKFLF